MPLENLSEAEKKLMARNMAKNLTRMLYYQKPYISEEQLEQTLKHIAELIDYGGSPNWDSVKE